MAHLGSATQMSVSGMSSNSFQSVDTSARWHGMIHESFAKKTRNALFRLFDYVSQTSPPMFGVHAIMTVWRVAQFLGPAFCLRYTEFWVSGSIMDKTTDYVSILFHLLPGWVRDEYAIYVCYVYIGLTVALLAFTIGSAAWLKVNARLPDAIPPTLNFIYATFGYILQPIAVTMAGETLGNIISLESYRTPFYIVGVVLCFIVLLVFVYIFSEVYTLSLLFKPDSLQSVVPWVQKFNIWMILLITILPAIGGQLSRIPSIAFAAVAAIGYALSIIPMTRKGGFVKQNHSVIMMATAASGCILMCIVTIFYTLNEPGSEIILIVYVAVWLACYVIVNLLLNRRANSLLLSLDIIEDDANAFEDEAKSLSRLLEAIVVGFRNAHPICVSFDIFKHAIQKWPKSIDLWLLFSKFSAIYPEQTQQLSYIQITMIQNGLKGGEAKHTIQQIFSVIKQREMNLVPDLKTKLDKIGKTVSSTKAKVRYIWDLVLQGNINELENVIARADAAVDETEKEFLYLLSMFPNNRFVARAYARFLRDVVADHAGHKQWAQNVSLLQRGVPVAPDQAHDLGIIAFPLLPNTLDVQQQITQNVTTNMTDDTLTQDIDADDDQAAMDAELRMSVKESINKLTIPAYWNTKVIRIVSVIVLFLIPMILITIFTPVFVEDLVNPLNFVYTLASLRTYCFQLTSVAMHLMYESMPDLKYGDHSEIDSGEGYDILKGRVIYPFEAPEFDEMEYEPAPVSFGSSWDSAVQLRYFCQTSAETVESLSPIRSYMPNDPDMELVRGHVFDGKIPFVHYLDVTFAEGWSIISTNSSHFIIHKREQIMSIQDVVMQYVYLGQNLIDNVIDFTNRSNNINLMNTAAPMTLMNNLEVTTDDITSAGNVMISYLQHTDDLNQLIILGAMIGLIVLVASIYIGCAIYTYRSIVKQKLMIYRCLTVLPKNVVSRVAESFRMLKKEEDEEMRTNKTHDEELNKQEENLLKIFSTSGDGGKGSTSDFLLIISVSILVMVMHIIIVVYMCINFMESSKQLRDAAPHIDYITATYSYSLASVILSSLLIGTAYPGYNFNVEGFTDNGICEQMYEWSDKSVEMNLRVRYGSAEDGVVSFKSLGIDIDAGTALTDCNADSAPANNHDVYKCWGADLLLSWTDWQIRCYALTYQHTYPPNTYIYAGNDIYMKHIWHIHQYHIFEQYFYVMFSRIVDMVYAAMLVRIPNMETIGFCLVALAILIEISFIIALSASEARQKFALRLLLHCPGNVIVANPHIMGVLSGDFEDRNVDMTTRGADFYDTLVMEMPDAILILEMDGTVKMANHAVKRIFGWESLQGKHISELGSEFIADQNPFADLSSQTQAFEKVVEFKKSDGNSVHIQLNFNLLPENLLIVGRDITQTVMYNRLISDERAKSDQLLSSILPAKLVPRVQAGETNISFAVQSVTIVFMDIVSFTPWCGSLPAATVMKTLNLMFKEYDALVGIHPTMTKIKCIGDCYMAAGGIFAELNQPSVHAKDVVEFGLDAIEALLRVNEAIDQKLRIRVGVNTGGPIVAGVLGTEKPTFEILGPPINMAQQMEHHGVPMKVHISRAVYELIYGSNFEVKERGEIEIKNGPVVTYLIEKRK